MFKRKQSLPALPAPPKLAEIQEDIQNANSNDEIFTCFINITNVAANKSNINESQGNGKEQDLNPEIVYDQVKRFVEENAKLEQSLLTIRELCAELEEAGSKLDSQMAAVRQEMYNTQT